jgi:uncharacterized MAPEG superfamily protein
MSTELEILAWTIVVGLVQIVLATVFSVRDRGLPWALSPRDDPGRPLGTTPSRLQRAQTNIMETFPFFAAAVLIADALDVHTTTTVVGAHLYLWSRVLYIPAYVLGIPVARTLVWAASVVGIVLILVALA